MNNDVTGNKRFAEDSMDYQQDQSAESQEKIAEEDEDIKDNIVVIITLICVESLYDVSNRFDVIYWSFFRL